jgi:nicotinamide mononucleotide (NMN) deamidase PncC
MVPGHDDAALHALAARLGDRLREQHYMVCTAESCTGGWIAKTITDIPGCSTAAWLPTVMKPSRPCWACGRKP